MTETRRIEVRRWYSMRTSRQCGHVCHVLRYGAYLGSYRVVYRSSRRPELTAISGAEFLRHMPTSSMAFFGASWKALGDHDNRHCSNGHISDGYFPSIRSSVAIFVEVAITIAARPSISIRRARPDLFKVSYIKSSRLEHRKIRPFFVRIP